MIRALKPDAQLPDDERSLVAAYRSMLTGKRVLILADDAKDAAQVRPLMPPTGSALLITSRQRFILEGMRRVDLERLGAEEAVALLRSICERLSDDEARQIATGCGRLPLALRIAGGVLANDETMSVARYLARLSDEKRKLAALKDPDDPDHDVEASIALSYELLDTESQATLCQLGVFAASFDLAAAGAVLGTTDQESLRDRLALLHRRSLLEFVAEQQRYDLHELVRVFALARLRERGEAEERAARLRHARHYITVAAEAERQYRSGGESIGAGLALFDRERANLDAARHWLQAHTGDDEIDALLIADADATANIGDLRYSKRDERIPQLEAALGAAERSGRRDAQGSLLGNLGLAYFALGEARRAFDFYQQALSLFRQIGDRLGEANCLKAIGDVLQFHKESDAALGSYQQALSLYRQIGDRLGEANCLRAIGDVQQFRGDRDAALGSYQQALALYSQIGAKLGEANVLAAQSRLLLDSEPARSQALLQEALEIRESIGDFYSKGADLGNYGVALLQRGRNTEARPYLEQARQLFAERGIQELLPQIDGLIAQAQGQAAPPQFPDLPEPVRQALEARDNTAFQAALEALPENERRAIIERLQEAGIIGRGPDMAEVLRQFEPLLRGIAAVARGDEGPREAVVAELARMEQGGWMLRGPVERIWAGERDRDALVEGLDEQDTLLVERVLELIDAPAEETGPLPLAQSPTGAGEGEEGLPPAVQAAIASGDQGALQEALGALSAEERARVEALLREASEQAIARARQRRKPEVSRLRQHC